MATAANLRKALHALARTDTLAQVYAIYGPSPTASFRIAKEVAAFLETGKDDVSDVPLLDAQIIDGSLRKMGIDEARSYAGFLYKKPVRSSRCTLIINRPDLFTADAQHALLKLFEEPPAHALVFLTVRNMNSLMQTLGSRMQTWYCGEPAAAEDKTSVQREAEEKAVAFLALPPAGRSAFIKALVEEDTETRDAMSTVKGPGIIHDAFIIEPFLAALIEQLARHPMKYAAVLAEALKRQTLMSDHTVSKKMQLEAISVLL